MPTTDQLQTQLDALTTRVNNLDGLGLVDPNLGTVQLLQRQLNGLQTTIKQSVLKMEQLYLDLKATVNNYVTLFQQKFGP
jgi:hypothetical protein